jgi:lipoyl(octanoyl) transferase
VRRFVHGLEAWLIAALGRLGVAARAVDGRVGIWVDDPVRGEAKIGAIGVRVRRWVTLHGFAINVAPDLSHFDGIVPCGLPDFAVTSLAGLGLTTDMAALDAALAAEFGAFLGALDAAQHGLEPNGISL